MENNKPNENISINSADKFSIIYFSLKNRIYIFLCTTLVEVPMFTQRFNQVIRSGDTYKMHKAYRG